MTIMKPTHPERQFEMFDLGCGLGPALGSNLGWAPRLTPLPKLHFFLPSLPFTSHDHSVSLLRRLFLIGNLY